MTPGCVTAGPGLVFWSTSWRRPSTKERRHEGSYATQTMPRARRRKLSSTSIGRMPRSNQL
ncbi:unnamed protein product [Symbiodinium natans]|uniref:Uncharacterized protein n=1 Tax=Symbiodinium natans TaxID=878477 RepID=A0A812MJM7_9DINO|nr:unnamed protein product [Symbiodinium natans]